MVHSSLAENSESSRRYGTSSISRGVRDIPRVTGKFSEPFGMVKNLVKKAMEDGSDVQLALLNFTNTVRDSYSTSRAQLLFGRRCRTLLPIQRNRLIPKRATDMYRDKKIAKNAQIAQYNKSAHHLNPLAAWTAHVDAWRMYTETIHRIVRGSRSRTHVQTQLTSSACCKRDLPQPDSDRGE